ncbi:MAG: VCBS repeat-containing protein [Chryseolinea sp.]
MALLTCIGCGKNKTLFSIHSGHSLGINFENSITTNDTLNALTFEYIYNGSGVGVGDFNNDGLPDLFFGGNQVSSELYLNKGNLKFENISDKAEIKTSQWITGVSVVDINRDNLLDIYLSVGGKDAGKRRKNILYINEGIVDGVPHFKDRADAYGLADQSYSTMAAFLDYDKDGDLDMYLVNNWLESFNRNNLRRKRINGEAESTDKLYRNNGDNTFTDISRQAGILIEGYGLGVNICDLNDDSWPDVYVSNDFMSNDLIWINQKDGTFKNMAGDYLKHQTHNGMGVDIADFNNDNLPDIIVVDMLPPDYKRQKLMTPGQNYDHFHMALTMGYEPQYMRNTLQLNRGKMPDGKMLFSEISFLAGVATTDWSWSPLFVDFDNDGRKDLFIGNGYRKDVTNLDFIFFGNKNMTFGTPEAKRSRYLKELDNLPEIKTYSYVFQNRGTLTFEDKAKAWGLDEAGFTNGAAYADLDLDGDIDLITNNIDQTSRVIENNINESEDAHHFISFQPKIISDLNLRIWVYNNGTSQFQELTPYRGFQSSSECKAHFGVGTHNFVDSAIVVWPDQSTAKYYNLKADMVVTLDKRDAKTEIPSVSKFVKPIFTSTANLFYSHEESSPSDIKQTKTLLHEVSQSGPCLAVGDVNGDNLDDVFIGGEGSSGATLFLQHGDGTFEGQKLPDDILEIGAALFFDADQDNDVDLYLAGACHSISEAPSRHRLYLNDGKGHFTSSENLPDLISNGSCIEAADFDNDGDLDLFVGGRVKVNEYPNPSRSYILKNDNGRFSDITSTLNPYLQQPGLVSSAQWVDINNDHKIDLVVSGEWMPIRVFLNQGPHFVEVTDKMGLDKTNGWWNCIKAADLDGDGYVDLVAGNTGRNSFFQPTLAHPVELVASDFDNNGSIDPIVNFYSSVEDDRFIVHNRLVLFEQIPGFKQRFETFTKYATTPFQKAFSKEELQTAKVMDAYSLSSKIFYNNNGVSFSAVDLPEIAQISTVNDILIDDLNGDTKPDLILIGNNYAQETLYGRYDASIGTMFMNDGGHRWKELDARETSFVIDGDSRYVRKAKTKEGHLIIVTINNGSVQTYKPQRKY